MARIIVQHDTDPTLHIEITDETGTGDYDGVCTGCFGRLSDFHPRGGSLGDFVMEADRHLTHDH
jgi:hypothetical protein